MRLRSRFRRSGGGSRLWHLFLAILLIAAVGWAIGLFWFAGQIPERVAEPNRPTQVIVVLTGGAERLQTGIDLLRRGLGEKLFVSGVYRGVDVRQLLTLSRNATESLSRRIAIGYEADDTLGNATETATWMEEEGYSSLRLVTSSYHMPRSLFLFRRAMPEVRIVPHPVFSESFKRSKWWLWPGSSELVINEYLKYLFARLWALLD